MLFFNIVSLYFNTLFNWYINLTIDGTIYPSQYFPFGAAFVCQAGKFWTLLRIIGCIYCTFILMRFFIYWLLTGKLLYPPHFQPSSSSSGLVFIGCTYTIYCFRSPKGSWCFFVFCCFATASLATSNSKKASESPELSLTYVWISSDVEKAGGLMQERKQRTF